MVLLHLWRVELIKTKIRKLTEEADCGLSSVPAHGGDGTQALLTLAAHQVPHVHAVPQQLVTQQLTVLRFPATRYNCLCAYDLNSPVHNVLDARVSITRGSGRGLDPGILEFFWAL